MFWRGPSRPPVSLLWSEESVVIARSINIASLRDEGTRLENLAN